VIQAPLLFAPYVMADSVVLEISAVDKDVVYDFCDPKVRVTKKSHYTDPV
jgi:hypothetical protein